RLAGANIIELRYEALVREPARQLRRVLDFCGLEYEPACLEFERSQRPVWTASGFQVRQSVNARSVGKWQRYAKFLEPVGRRLHDSIVAYEAAPDREILASGARDPDGY
ncbi:MAG: sulfotransferase, partial [Gammaproteobacteria bacterium]